MIDYQYTRILEAVTAAPWAILPSKLALIRDVLAYRASGERLTEAEIAERLHANTLAAAHGRATATAPHIALIPIVGTIVPRGGMFTEASGAVSVDSIAGRLRAALADPDVGSIVLDVDSPGGQVSGVDELATEIYQARGQKPITAVVNSLAASAAYWAVSAADEVIVTPSGQVGSIGVFAMHEDISQAIADQGVVVNLISAGKYKTEGNPFEPLTDEARAAIQGQVDDYYTMFVAAVARNRGVKRADVRGGFGQGRVVGAKEAVASGMADRVGTLSQTLQRLGNGRRRRRSAMAGKKLEIEQLKGAQDE